MSGNSDDAHIRQRSQLLERYADRLERWTRARLPATAEAGVDVAEVVRNAIAEAVTNSFKDKEAPVLIHVRERLQTRIVHETGRQAEASAEAGEHRAPPSSRTPWLAAELLERYDASLGRLTLFDKLAIVARLELGLPWSEVLTLLDKPTAAAAQMSVSRALVRLAREMSR